jgi:hypothetical protein|tara:strand:- start:632 stop:1138 length:507 start_codon:yes stop_codon:yes gene_type:complete
MAKKVKIKFPSRTRQGERYMICRNSVPGGKYWKGVLCNTWTKVGDTATAVLCSCCVQKVVEPPEIKSRYKSKGFPRGWQFRKEFVHEDGTVYHKGVEQTKLKGTLPATKIDTSDKKKMSKKEKQTLKDQILQQMVFVRGELKTSKWKKDIRANHIELRKLERRLKKLN